MTMQQMRTQFEVGTEGQGFYEITDRLHAFVSGQAIEVGLLTVFLHHTSASLMIQENADPTVQEDFLTFFRRLAPEDEHSYRHGYEGPDDMPAHIRTAMTAVQLSIPVNGGRPDLGIWQGVYVVEHRYRTHQRRVTLHLIGE
jgi:secondary thiamine-phosphate synthase enzyme